MELTSWINVMNSERSLANGTAPRLLAQGYIFLCSVDRSSLLES